MTNENVKSLLRNEIETLDRLGAQMEHSAATVTEVSTRCFFHGKAEAYRNAASELALILRRMDVSNA